MPDITGYYEFYDNQNFVGELQILKVEANGSLVGNLADKPIVEGVFNDATGQIFFTTQKPQIKILVDFYTGVSNVGGKYGPPIINGYHHHWGVPGNLPLKGGFLTQWVAARTGDIIG